MSFRNLTAPFLIGACAVALGIGALTSIEAQQPQGQPAGAGGRGGGRGGSALNVFTAADANKDGVLTRDELKAAFTKWLGGADSLTQEQLAAALNAAFPQPAPQAGRGTGGGRAAAAPQNRTPNPADVEKMMAALPDKAPAKPKKAHKVLVLSKTAGFVHSCIPLVDKTVEAIGKKTGAWTTDVSYDPADINAQNLQKYDLVFLNNTTGAFLDDPNDPTATEARKKALLEFVRSGKGLAGIHAAADSYHEQARTTPAPGSTPTATAFGGGRGGPGTMLAMQMLMAGDSNGDKKLSRAEMMSMADAWFDKMDTEKAGTLSQQIFTTRFATVLPNIMPATPAGTPGAGRQGKDTQTGTWPDFNKMIGGYFKFHWMDPQLITVKIDDPKSPVTANFKGLEFEIHDETYTFGINSWSRENLHVLTSIDYAKMSDADKLKEDWPREDHDYGLSWIRREGKGRVFYEAHGHSERVYAMKNMLEHVTAGIQYALGDLKANDAPSVKPKK